MGVLLQPGGLSLGAPLGPLLEAFLLSSLPLSLWHSHQQAAAAKAAATAAAATAAAAGEAACMPRS